MRADSDIDLLILMNKEKVTLEEEQKNNLSYIFVGTQHRSSYQSNGCG